jgi:hypothetical protein
MTEDEISSPLRSDPIRCPVFVRIIPTLVPILLILSLIGYIIKYLIPSVGIPFVARKEFDFLLYGALIAALPVGLTGLILYMLYVALKLVRATTSGILLRFVGILVSISCIVGFFIVQYALAGAGF